MPHLLSMGAAPAYDASPLGAPPALPQCLRLILTPKSARLTPTRSTSGLSRSLPQPMMVHWLPSTSYQGRPPSASVAGTPRGRPMFSLSPPFATSVTPNRGMPGESGRRWPPGVVGPLSPDATNAAARNMQPGKGQQHLLAITPTHGEEILIPVDIRQASKQADEKRQRNAGASARFRLRKKEKEREQQQGLQRLEAWNRDLERGRERSRELDAERDFYRNERKRLQGIVAPTPALVAPTPGISERADLRPRLRGTGQQPLDNTIGGSCWSAARFSSSLPPNNITLDLNTTKVLERAPGLRPP